MPIYFSSQVAMSDIYHDNNTYMFGDILTCIRTMLPHYMKKGLVKLNRETQLNRMEFILLDTLYANECKDRFHSMTLSEISEDNDDSLGVRATLYRKMKKLVKIGYVKKGCLDNHADTFYLGEGGIRVVEECKEVDR